MTIVGSLPYHYQYNIKINTHNLSFPDQKSHIHMYSSSTLQPVGAGLEIASNPYWVSRQVSKLITMVIRKSNSQF